MMEKTFNFPSEDVPDPVNFSLGLFNANLTALRGTGFGFFNDSFDSGIDVILTQILGAKRKDINSVTALTVIYSAIFVTGVVGNVCTCVVIARNAYMHTVTNFYLFSLAVSDVLTLLFALPPELYSVWEAYPWHFGEAFCVFKSYLAEMTSNASVLLITSVTVERYVAICHPMRGQRCSRQSRAIKCIFSIVIISALCALPYPIHTRVFPFAIDPRDKLPISESVVCNIPSKWINRMSYFFQISTFVFFVIPMVVITVMYLLIGMKLRQSALQASTVQQHMQQCKNATTRARRAVLKMLVAVVVAFFVCWAPFHAQRLMTLYIGHEQWTPELLMVQSHLFYVSGVLYFLSSTINPILYNMLSRKFRQAFKRTLCRCFLDFESDSIPPLYKLKAKFIIVDNEHPSTPNQGEGCCLYPDNVIRLAKFTDNDGRKGHRIQTHGYAQQSTSETICKQSSPLLGGVSTGSHPHSDGRLYSFCRHRYCSVRRAHAMRRRGHSLESQAANINLQTPPSGWNSPLGASKETCDIQLVDMSHQNPSNQGRQNRKRQANLNPESPFRFSDGLNVSW